MNELRLIPRPAARENYGLRHGRRIDRIVMHVTEGSFEGTIGWFKNPTAKVSAHYVVAKDGRLAVCVDDALAAWHAGHREINLRSIGVELEGHVADPALCLPGSTQFDVAARLVAGVCKRHALSVDRSTIIGHAEVPHPSDPSKRGGKGGHTDPGPFFRWDAFMAAVAGYGGLA